MTDVVFLSSIFLIAVLYSSVGHGGASGYLALMALFGIAPENLRPAALILNIFVSAISYYAFSKNGHFKAKLLWPFAIASIPMAFLGGLFSINPQLYKFILGLFLIIAIIRMLFMTSKENFVIGEIKIKLALAIGAVLGFFSGLIGIGGGIILSPVILLLGWANMKQTAAVSAAFILLNSIAGLSGVMSKGIHLDNGILFMLSAGILGGLIGSRLGSFHYSEKILRNALSIVLIFASFKLLVF